MKNYAFLATVKYLILVFYFPIQKILKSSIKLVSTRHIQVFSRGPTYQIRHN